jgi:hypothetical protein
MRVLFDQGTPTGIREALSGHLIKTAREQGWNELLNGELLRVAEDAGFEVLLTTDKNIVHQQNLKNRRIAIVALSRNKWSLIQLHLERIAKVIASAKPGSYTLVEIE